MSYTKISIIALGETGSGKSLFCKLFSGSERFFSKKATESVTTEINSITFKNEKKKVEIFLIDTPGSNDSRGTEQDKKNLILTQKFISEQPRINCIILVMNIQNPRFTDSIKKAIKNICQCFPLPDFWTHVIIFWTHCKFEDEEDELLKRLILKKCPAPESLDNTGRQKLYAYLYGKGFDPYRVDKALRALDITY